jgi:hypothetical protein
VAMLLPFGKLERGGAARRGVLRCSGWSEAGGGGLLVRKEITL